MQKIFTKVVVTIILTIFTVPLAIFSKDGTQVSTPCNNPGSAFLYAAFLMAQQSDEGSSKEGILSNQRIRIINLGPVVNYSGLDYAPTVSADGKTLFFVSDRPGSKLTKDGDPSHDFWAVKKNDRLDTIFFKPYNIDTVTGLNYLNVNSEFNEGAASIAADRQTLYFTACNRPDGLGDCDIYRSTIEGDRWGRPVNLGKNVNSDSWDSQPSIAPDQSRIYFVSTRKGPNSDGKLKLENMDIWYSDRDPDTEEWMPAKNLESINTKESEQTPFISADNVTLFFSSNGLKPSYGGMDFYITRFDPSTNKWSTPDNLGAPINTKDDEMFISLPASGDIIYFSSKRTDLPGYQGNLDIFMAFVPSFFKATNVIGTVIDECSGDFIPAHITVKNPITGRVVNDSVSFSRQEFEVIVSNTDFGNPKDSLKFVDLEITAENVKYGSKTIVQRVEKPTKTENPDEAKKFDEIRVRITLGQRPVLGTEINEADYIKTAKAYKPDLASFRGLVMKETKTWNLYPLLNYVFFDAGQSKIPSRYKLFEEPDETALFADTTIEGGTLDKYYHVLNIYGFRLRQHPDVKIEIVGCNDGNTPSEKGNLDLSKTRAEQVYNYLKDIWKIDPSRMKMSYQNLPKVPSNIRVDTIGNQENRRVEILCDNWEVMKPVFDRGSVIEPQPDTMNFVMKNGIEDQLVDKRRIEINRGEKNWKTLTKVGITDDKHNWDWRSEQNQYPKDEVPFTATLVVTTKSGAECKSDPIVIPVMQVTTQRQKIDNMADSTREVYNLILFPFDRSDAGPINERIMNDYVYERCKPTSVIMVTGHTDVVGMYDHNQKLSERRSGTVKTGINSKTKGKVGRLESVGDGEENPLYTNDLPEGRFYNRTVQVSIRTPLKEYENEN